MCVCVSFSPSLSVCVCARVCGCVRVRTCMFLCVFLYLSFSLCVCVSCTQRSGLMSTGGCHTPLPLLINWLVVDVFGALSVYPQPPHPPFFWQLSFNHLFLMHGVCMSPGRVLTAAFLLHVFSPSCSLSLLNIMFSLYSSSFICCLVLYEVMTDNI